MNPFNIFETCFLDIDENIFLKEEGITEKNKNIITLLKYYDETSNKTFHLGDIYCDKLKNTYYVFSFLKDKRLISLNGVLGFGFYVFKEYNKTDFELYKMEEFNRKFNLSLFDEEFIYMDNIFRNKNKFNNECSNHYYNVRNLNNFWIFLKDNDFIELELTVPIKFFVAKRMINITNFYFYIKMYQKNIFNKELSDAKSILNGSLFIMNDYTKEIHKQNQQLFLNEISKNENERKSISKSMYDNIVNYYDRFFVYIDKTGSVKFLSLNEDKEDIRKSKNLIFIKHYLFENISPPPFCDDEEKELYLDALFSIIDA